MMRNGIDKILGTSTTANTKGNFLVIIISKNLLEKKVTKIARYFP
jgi:hypothetical protein